jgi:hypothetical protein
MRPFVTHGLLAVLAGLLFGLGARAGEEKVKLDKVPRAVLDAIKAKFPGAKIVGASTEKDGDKTVYEISLKYKDAHHDVTVEPEGKILDIEKTIAFKDLPRAVADALEAKYPKATYKIVEELTKGDGTLVGYEALLVTTTRKTWEVKLDPKGKILSEEDKTKGEKEEKGKEQAGGYQTEFKVDKANLASTGRNPYFILEPGHYLIFENGDEKLTVTVKKETKTVDGVECRVVEEKEEKGGKPVEISQNYYALDRTTGDVYYFGEHVDNYKDGKVVNHKGSWLSGVKGAKFGLMMPGKVKVGMKYQQEQAPGAGMDRAEIVSMTETVETPVGTFKNCVKIVETTPLEPDTQDHKYYAAGIGLVQDGKAKLTKHGFKGKKQGAAPRGVRAEPAATVTPAASAAVIPVRPALRRSER